MFPVLPFLPSIGPTPRQGNLGAGEVLGANPEGACTHPGKSKRMLDRSDGCYCKALGAAALNLRTRPQETASPQAFETKGFTEIPFLEVHWITWVVRMRMVCGKVRPRALAVFILTTSSNRMGCSTGRSAGLAPFRSLST